MNGRIVVIIKYFLCSSIHNFDICFTFTTPIIKTDEHILIACNSLKSYISLCVNYCQIFPNSRTLVVEFLVLKLCSYAGAVFPVSCCCKR